VAKWGFFTRWAERTGKTITALAIARYYRCQRILVIAPLSAVKSWRRDVEKVWPSMLPYIYEAFSGTVPERAAQIRARHGKPGIVVVRYESFWMPKMREAILAWKPDMVIADEAHRLIHRASKQSKFAHKLAEVVPYRLALTGTPHKSGRKDYFSIFKFIDPQVFGRRWKDFETKYCILDYFGNVKDYRHKDEIDRLVAEHSHRITADVLGLDAPSYEIVSVDLSPKTREIYERMRKESLAEVTGLSEQSEQVSGTAVASITLTNLLRLQQITSGWIKTTDDQIIDISSEKLDALLDLLEDAVPQFGRIAVFCYFRHDIDRIVQAIAARNEHPSTRLAPVIAIQGGMSQTKFNEAEDTFNKLDKVILVGQIGAMSLGMDLTAGRMSVLFGLDYDLTTYLQALARMWRHGQQHHVLFKHLLCMDTVDVKVYQTLQKKQSLAAESLDHKMAIELFS